MKIKDKKIIVSLQHLASILGVPLERALGIAVSEAISKHTEKSYDQKIRFKGS